MDYGVHLPLIDVGRGLPTLAGLRSYAERAADLGYRFLCANDHLLFRRAWLDGPTALAAVAMCSGEMWLATTVLLPVVRGPVAAAKTVAALDRLSGGRLVVGVGPGSSLRDYRAVGVPFEERWKRLDEAVPCLRALLAGRQFRGRFYSTEGAVEPLVVRAPPIWIGSWGSDAGLRRVAPGRRLACLGVQHDARRLRASARTSAHRARSGGPAASQTGSPRRGCT